MPALSTFCLKVFFLHFHIKISMVIIFLKHNGAVTMSHSCHSKENIIFPNWIWIFSQRTEFSHFFDTCDFFPYLKENWNQYQLSAIFHLFFKKKHWQCFRAKYILHLKKIDTVSACEIYEALSAILWEVGRERAPIFSRDHFLFSTTIDCPILNTI